MYYDVQVSVIENVGIIAIYRSAYTAGIIPIYIYHVKHSWIMT